jgi:diphthamide synthase (EF-2-diphthine--ammonia ligase)
MPRPKTLLSWSSGKDCAWALHVLRARGEVEVVGLVTTFDETTACVGMHGTPMALVRAQAAAAQLPLIEVPLPWPCSNADYEQRMRALVERAVADGVTRFAFGDLFLEDVRRYREERLAGTGIEPVFPVWTTPQSTAALAREMLASGLAATLVAVDTNQLAAHFAGRLYDATLLADLPETVDPCGERGEFHTFCHAGPMFARPVPFESRDEIDRDGLRHVVLDAVRAR